MAAGLGYIEFATGDILTAAAANGYLASQTVMVFADSAARSAAITSPQEGMVSYLKDTNAIEYYSGSAWTAVGASSGGMTLINTGGTALTGATTTVSSIAGTYTNLVIYVKDFYGTADDLMKLVLNGDTTGANYTYSGWRARSGSTALDWGTDNRITLFALDNTSAANFVSITIPLYAGGNQKQFVADINFKSDSAGEAGCNVVTKWANTAAITSVGINIGSGTWSAGTMYVYGVK